jgi:hypothetical protein
MDHRSAEVHPELERLRYFKLSYEDLERIDDVESMLERGFRLCYGIDKTIDREKGLELIQEADRRGHPVARALLAVKNGEGMPEYCTESAARGHHLGASTRTY